MQPVQTRLTASEYLAIPHDYPYIRELLDGEIVLSGSPKPIHNFVVMSILKLLQSLVLKGTLMIAPMDVYFDDENVVQPDLFWVSNTGTCLQTDNAFRGAPDLIVEVLSPSTAKRDKGYKFRLYERHGVGEYWLVDSERGLLEVWVLDNGHYLQLGVFEQGETFDSRTLGKTVKLENLF